MNKSTPPRIIFEPASRRRTSASGDCACAENWPGQANDVAVRANRLHPDEQLTCAAGLYSLPIDTEYRFVFDLVSDSTPAVVNRPAWELLASCRSGASVRSFGDGIERQAIDTLSQLGLVKTSAEQDTMPPPAALTAWLHVTDTCNLRCDYCYLPKRGDSMSAETGEAAIEAVFRAAHLHDFRLVKLKYAGGEATLNFRRVLQMQDRAASLSARHGIALESVILTNGVGMSALMLDALKARRVKIMISLDGVGPTHDAQRAFADGRGSFTLVAGTIDRLIAAAHPPQISITITDRNVETVTETVAWVLDRGLAFSLNFYRESDCSASFRDLRLAQQRLIAEMRRAYAEIEKRLPQFSLIGSLLDKTHFAGRHERACGAGHHYLAIDQRGGIAKCQMGLDQTVADVRSEDPLALIRADETWLTNLPATEKEGCRDCQWQYWCAGGCPIETFRATGRWDVKSPWCQVYQALLPEVLRLEGLRLLKYYQTTEVVL